MQQLWRPATASVIRDPATGATQLNAGGYGYGLRVSQTCSFRHVVAHSGGLPGFGSVMQWLPEYGVGIIAFGNLTYTGWGRPTAAAFDALVKTGGMHPRTPAASPALTQARDSVTRLIQKWDDRLADDVAAGNLFLDVAKDRRRAEIESLRAAYGACTPPSEFDDVENALRGRWTMTCEKGKLAVSITLAPTVPPKVQFLSVRPAPLQAPPAESCPQ
jgi:hypothetical protein